MSDEDRETYNIEKSLVLPVTTKSTFHLLKKWFLLDEW